MAPATQKRVELLDEEGEMMPKFEDALAYIFQKYCSTESDVGPSTSTASTSSATASSSSPKKPSPLPKLGSRPPPSSILSNQALDLFATQTNGEPFSQDSKDELKQFLDCNDQGELTYRGFLGLYHLQSDNDLEETWKDLKRHGFDDDLTLGEEEEEEATKEALTKTEDAGSKSIPSASTKEADSQLDPTKDLLISLHVKHIMKLSSNTTSLAYHLSTHLRMNGVYWGLMALEIMGRGHELKTDEVVDFVMSCWDSKSGGFASFPRHDPHILSTLSAIQILAIKDRLDVLDKEKVIQFILSLQSSTTDLFYGDPTRLEEDTRFLYCSVQALCLLGALDRIDRRRTIDAVLSCSNFDGGFGRVRGAESHSGQVFVCLAALCILDALPPNPNVPSSLNLGSLSSWLSDRQLPSGGLNGRPQKLPDVCYSWWVLSSLSMLGKLHWINSPSLQSFILSSQDPENGGLADRPENVTDVFHTYFGLAGLSLLGYGGLTGVDPVYGLPRETVERMGIGKWYQRMD